MTGGGVFHLKPGQWTDDTAMAVMGRSLVDERGFRPLSVLRERLEWYRHGKHSCTGSCFDIGSATKTPLSGTRLYRQKYPLRPWEMDR
jgi:ADP-ribosyl-[dinitrogen reductase] hydrolase